MKRIVLIMMLLFSVSCIANDINYFEENSSLVTSDDKVETPIEPPINMESDAPISDYQYTLLVLAIGVGVYGISKNNKQKII